MTDQFITSCVSVNCFIICVTWNYTSYAVSNSRVQFIIRKSKDYICHVKKNPSYSDCSIHLCDTTFLISYMLSLLLFQKPKYRIGMWASLSSRYMPLVWYTLTYCGTLRSLPIFLMMFNCMCFATCYSSETGLKIKWIHFSGVSIHYVNSMSEVLCENFMYIIRIFPHKSLISFWYVDSMWSCTLLDWSFVVHVNLESMNFLTVCAITIYDTDPMKKKHHGMCISGLLHNTHWFTWNDTT